MLKDDLLEAEVRGGFFGGSGRSEGRRCGGRNEALEGGA